jgi:hypothetical protein
MIDEKTKKEMLEYADRIYELEQLDVVKEFTDILHKVVGFKNEKPKKEYYKSSSKYDYFIVYPYEEFTVLNSGKYGFRKHGYDASGKSVDGKGELLFCLGLCNKTKEEMIEYIEQHIREDNEEVES